MDSLDVHCLPRPAKFPVLNSIENVWRDMKRHIYAHKRQFATSDDLMNAIQAA